MDLKNIELLVKNSALIVQLMTLFSFLFIFSKKEKYRNYSLKWIAFCIFSLSLYVLIELILSRIIFNKNFIYFKDYISPILKFYEISNMNFLAPISYLIKFTFYGLFFTKIFSKNIESKSFKWLTFFLILFVIIMVFYFKSYQSYDSISSTVKNIFILIGSGLLLFKIYKAEISNISLYKNSYLWVGFALFATAISELFLELVFTKLHDSDLAGFYKLYLVRNAFQVAFFIMMIVAFLNTKYLRFLPEKY